MSATFIDIAKQCCDADEYLDMGYQCAQGGQCYNPLRTIGDTIWFGVPYALNTTENIFFYLHLFLMILVGVSVFCLLKKILPTLIFLLTLSLLTWPTFFYTLTDTPATLFFVEGIVLALIGINHSRTSAYLAAGIFLGFSALLRTAYFYPLIIAGILFFIYLLWQKKRQWHTVFILGFFIPLLFQFFTTLTYTGQWHFLSEGRSRSMMNLHLNSDAAGYDTVMPQAGLFWKNGCSPQAGLLPALKSVDIASAACILKGRLQFYFGSYASSTFLGGDDRNFFDNSKTYKTNKIDDLYLVESKSLLALPPGSYRYSTVLQTTQRSTSSNANLRLSDWAILRNTTPHKPLIEIKTDLNQSIAITNEPKTYTLDVNHTANGYMVFAISSPDEFIATNVTLSPVSSAQGYFNQEKSSNNIIGENTQFTRANRLFSNAYLIVNIIVISIAAFYLLKPRTKDRSAIFIFIFILLLSVLAQCLVIIPEQRYMQAFLCACWLMNIALLTDRHRQS